MGFSVSQILAWTGGRLVNEAALGSRFAAISVERASPLSQARASDIAFFFSKSYQHELPLASPGVLITAEPFVRPMEAAKLPFWGTCAVIACADPYLAMAILSEKVAAAISTAAHVPGTGEGGEPRVHSTAVVAPTAKLGEGAQIGAYCVIEDGVRIGERTVLYPGCYVGPGSSIGNDTVLFPRVTVYEWTEIGNRVRIHAGSVLGADGFGYAPRRDGSKVVGHQKIYHVGKVVIGDDAELGANSCVDRGTFGETKLDRNAKIDNLVQVAHNARIDEGGVVCGGAALAGNASVGRYAYVGGLTGVTNQVHIGDGASVGAVSLVTKDVPPGGTAVGNPQREHKEHFKAHAILSRMVNERKAQKGSKQQDE